MKLILNGRNIELTDALKAHVHDKLGRLNEHFDFVMDVHVFLSVEKNPRINEAQRADATVFVKGGVIRVQTTSDNMYTSVDQLLAKVERALRRQKEKVLHRNKSQHSHGGDSIRHVEELPAPVVQEETPAEEAPHHDDEHEFYTTYEHHHAPVSG